MFGEKGVILRSALCERVKVTLALWESKKKEGLFVPLIKPIVRRYDKQGAWKNNAPYRVWLNSQETAALIVSLQRALVLMEEYHEGTLDLKDILAEDEDVRLLVATEGTMFPNLENMFTLPGDRTKD